DDLRAVREVAELRLPEDERRRVRHGVAELEAHDGVLGEEAVDHLEARLLGRDGVERDELAPRLRIREDGMPLAERPAPRVLPREAHRRPLEEELAEGE